MKTLFAIILIGPVAGCAVLPAAQSLNDAVNASVSNLCSSGTNQTCLKEQLCTNRAPWTWPLQLSFIGTDIPGGLSHPLIAPNFVVANRHYGAENWTNTTTFRYNDTNGIAHDIPFSGTNFVVGDLVLCELSSNADGVDIPFILPPNYTNYFSGHSPTNLPLFWFHHNASTLDYCRLNSFFPAGAGGFLETVTVHYATSFHFGGRGPTVGDSGSPVMTALNGKVILLFCETDGGGCGVSDLIFYTNLIRHCAPRLVDLSAYQTLPPAPFGLAIKHTK